MKAWKKNAVIATVLVLVCAGIYLNWAYAGRDETQDLTQTLNADQVLDDATMVIAPSDDALQTAAAEGLDETTDDYFAAMRLSRQEARDSARIRASIIYSSFFMFSFLSDKTLFFTCLLSVDYIVLKIQILPQQRHG